MSYISRWWKKDPVPVPPPVPSYAVTMRGMNTHLLRASDLAALAKLGITHIRLPAILQYWEDGTWREYLPALDHAARHHGLTVLWMASNIPEGYSEPARLASREDWMIRMTLFAEYLASLPCTEAIQLWNEQDQWVQTPFGAYEGHDPYRSGQLYAEQLIQAYPRIKAVRSDVIVVSGATADYGHNQRWEPFLRGMLSMSPPVDAIAMHAYGEWGRIAEMYRTGRRIVGTHAPLWATEHGNDQGNGSITDEAHHLECWKSVIEGNQRERLVQRLYGYALQTDPRPQFSQHGLFKPRPDGTAPVGDGKDEPRPTYDWLVSR